MANRRRVKRINLQEQFIMAYGGLRGAVGFSLVEMIRQEVLAFEPHLKFVWVTGPLCLSSSSALHFSDYSFLVHHLLTRMTSISLCVKWPMTSQLHGSFLKEQT
jgi:NhaP-type Na+/H+ or K+/H+ antiporter